MTTARSVPVDPAPADTSGATGDPGDPRPAGPGGEPRPRPAGTVPAVVLGVVALQALLLVLFAWPALHGGPHDLPVVVAGPPAATGPFARHLRTARPGAFDVTTSTDPAAADAALRERTAYAAFLIGPRGVELHVASAAGVPVAEAFRQLAQGLGQRQGRSIPVTDVVPADRDDPHGVVLSVGVLPLALTSMAAGILLGLLARGRWTRLLGVVLFAALAGSASTAVAQYGLSALSGDYLTNAATVGLLALCVSGVLAGLVGLVGARGAALGVLVMFVLGVPLSGLTSAPDLMPVGWGTLGQYLPPGAGGTVLRSVAFFDGAGAGRALGVLAGWAVLGLVLLVLARRRPGMVRG